MVINRESIPKVVTGIKVRDEKFGLLLVSKRTPILALNADSTMIWKYFDGKRSIEDIAVKISAKGAGGLPEIVEIVECFVESCYDLGLIEL